MFIGAEGRNSPQGSPVWLLSKDPCPSGPGKQALSLSSAWHVLLSPCPPGTQGSMGAGDRMCEVLCTSWRYCAAPVLVYGGVTTLKWVLLV